MTILYVNGDSHSAGAEAVNPYCFAEDDPLYWALGRGPHPVNLQASYGCLIANKLNATLNCDAESAASNDRIMRTTQEYIIRQKPNLVIIGWSTWEREEWLHNGTYYQVTASGSDSVPEELRDKYKYWVIEQDYRARERKMLKWHNRIYQLHQKLQQLNISHLFFNTYTDFEPIKTKQITTDTVAEAPPTYEWNGCYVDPYDQSKTYYHWLKNSGFKTVNPNSYHFGADAHEAWAEFLYQNYIHKLLLKND